MIKRVNIFKSALLISALFLLSPATFSQEDILTLLPGSDYLEYNELTGVHRLIGNVSFIYQGNTMYCDSAHYHQKNKNVRAYGHVHINKRDTINLFCDSLNYNGRTRQAKLWGNVRVRDNEYKLTTDTLDYDAKKGQAHYHYGGKVESIVSREVLTSKVGYFHPEAKNFFFSHDVNYVGKDMTMTTDTLRYVYSQSKAYFFGPTNILRDSTTMYCESGWYNTNSGEGSLTQNAWISREKDYITADSLFYIPEEQLSIGIGSVYYRDSLNKIGFQGEYAYSSDSLGYSFLTGNALAIKELDDDTVYFHADTLHAFKLDTNYLVKAYYGAKIFSTSVQAQADSIIYDQSRELIELFEEPVVWSDKAELKGIFIDIKITDSIIHKVNIYDDASILMEIEPEHYYNQVAGKTIEAYFKENDLYKAIANGNAITIFFPEEESKTDSTFTKKRLGMNRLYASNLRIDIDSNEVVGISYIDQPEGAFYPLEKIKREEQFIPTFNWKTMLRPKELEDVFEEREVVEEQPEPQD